MSNEDIKLPRVDKPNDRLSITVNDKAESLFMSGGLIRQLVPIASSLGDFAIVYQSVDIQQALVVETLRPRNTRGEAEEKVHYSFDSFVMSNDDMERLITWIMDHVLYFFVNSLSLTKNLATKNLEVMKSIQTLTQSLSGSPDSAATKPSVGATESASAT